MTLLVNDLAVKYGRVVGTERVTFGVQPGRTIALLGANGAGKTTTLRAVGGLLPFHGGTVVSGEIFVSGERLNRQRADRRVRDGLAQSLEGRRVFGDLTVKDNLVLGGFAARRRPQSRDTLAQVLTLFPRLGERLGQRAGTLSGGEQQMLAIGRAVMARPTLLLLDEPSLGLAPRIVGEIALAIREIATDGAAVVIADQNMQLAKSAADEVLLLQHGRTVKHGPTLEMLKDPVIQATYLGDTDAAVDTDSREAQT